MRKYFLWGFMLFFSASICAGFYFYKKNQNVSDKKPYTLHTVNRETLEITIGFSGYFGFNEQYIQHSRIAGRISDNLIEEGSIIRPGDTIFLLDTGETIAGRIAAYDEFLSLSEEMAEEKISSEDSGRTDRDDEELARHKIDYFEKELGLIKNQKDYSLKEYIEARGNLIESRKALSAIRKNQLVYSSRGSLRQKNTSDKMLRSLERREAYETMDKIVFTGPSDAILLSYINKDERNISEGTPLFRYALISDFRITASVDPSDYFRIIPGTVATVEVRYTDQYFSAEVISKSPVFSTDSELPMGTVFLKLISPENCMYPNLDCDVSLMAYAEDVLTVPVSAVSEEEDGNLSVMGRYLHGGTFVYTFNPDNRKVHKSQIRPGMSDGNMVEVQEGLKEGLSVICGDITGLKDDMSLSTGEITF